MIKELAIYIYIYIYACYYIHATKTGRGKRHYLEKIMNTRVLKLFQGHVIARSHILASYSLFKPLPSQVFILQKVHRDPLGRLGWGRSSGLGRSDINKDGWVNINNLDGRLGGRKIRPSNLRPGQFVLHLLSLTTGKVSQIQRLRQSFSLISSKKMRLGLSLRPGCPIHILLPFILFHSCHP